MSTSKHAKRIGFLATGSEITTGEITNTNSQNMALTLQDHGVHIGEHLCCDDNVDNIESGLTYLLERHDAVIITGGLGPTSDDCTRTVVAKLARKKLVFDEATWQNIVKRFEQRKLPLTDNNKQQAYFPEKSTILTNDNGTAGGCALEIDKTPVFMLPGPPRECLPIFQKHVLPILLKDHFGTPKRLVRWRLMNIAESKIAEMLEPVAEKHHLHFAYRAHYPFTDIKLFIEPQTKQHTKILLEIETIVRPYFTTHLNQTLRQQLLDQLTQQPTTLYLDDQATRGALKQALLSPATQSCFVGKNIKAHLEIYLEGLEGYWNNNHDGSLLDLKLELRYGKKREIFTTQVLNRGKETIDYAIEFSAWKILNFI